jgi:GNAT superfamily N-acetyltransferase
MTIRVAEDDDLRVVLGLLNGSAAWLHSKGVDQWPSGFTADRIRPCIESRRTLLAEQHGHAAGTVAVSPWGDSDFWTDRELIVPAWYVSKLAVARVQAGRGIGDWILRWVSDLAASNGVGWIRLDAWRTNRRLHQWYADHGWEPVRVMNVPGRGSGALFRRRAVPDPDARKFFLPAVPSASCT